MKPESAFSSLVSDAVWLANSWPGKAFAVVAVSGTMVAVLVQMGKNTTQVFSATMTEIEVVSQCPAPQHNPTNTNN